MNATLAVSFVLCAAALQAAPMEQQIRDDWDRHDQQRVAQIREPGQVPFPTEALDWPGVKRDERIPVPNSPAPRLDGVLDDPCWTKAFGIPSKLDDASPLVLTRDEQHLYVGFSLPTQRISQHRGHYTARDAAGAVDGIKDGKYAFHTWLDVKPWWQVDLGAKQPIQRIVVYNRLDYAPGLHNADHLIILTSDDEKNWTMCYDNEGRHFGGATSGKPLEVSLDPATVQARYVRLQLKQNAPLFLHLDEVEIFGAAQPEANIALNRPAKQSSLSRWSRGGERGCDLFTIGSERVTFAAGNAMQVLRDGVPLAADCVGIRQEGDSTSVELALPLAKMKATRALELSLRDGHRVPLSVARDWQISWRTASDLGFGKNTLTLELQVARDLAEPVHVHVETVAFTALRAERTTICRRTFEGPTVDNVEFNMLHEGPVAVVVSSHCADSRCREGDVFFVPPVQETLQRAERLLGDFSVTSPPPALTDLRRRIQQLVDDEASNGPDVARRRELYYAARSFARDVAFSNPQLDFDAMVFVKRYTQQTYPDVCLNHMPWCSRPGGDVCIVSPLRPDGQVRPLIDGQLGPGHIHGMDLWYDADRVVFGYAQSPTDQPPGAWLNRAASYELRRTVEPTHLFEMNIDGSGLRQITDGEWSDLDPTYLPSGEVVFTSERCGYSLQCNELDKDETSCNLYAVAPENKDVRRLTLSKDGDYLAHTLDNGMIGYTRWEYQERGWANIQSIWVVRPDGTGADALFKQHFNDPWAIEDARSIPGSEKLVAIATGHHTLATGPVVIVDPTVGINNPAGIRIVTPGVLPPEGGMTGIPVPTGGVLGKGGMYQTPWPLSEKHFLVSYTFGDTQDEKGYAIYLIDVHGTRELVYRDPEIACSLPIPLRPRSKPPILGSAFNSSQDLATCLVTDIYEGVDGVEPGTIRYLRISSRLPWPYDNHFGGHRFEPNVKSVMINWTPAKVIGTVPVEPDGSANFHVPADVPVYFQALDANHMEVRRMRSFINFQPGEVRGCTGCHETRGEAPVNLARAVPRAMRRVASHPEPPSWGTEAMSFLRDVQPVFDQHCVRCHAGLKPAGDIDLSSGLTAQYNRAWETINDKQLISRSNVGDDARITLPYEFGSHKSKLLVALRDKTHADAVRLTNDDWLRLVTWIDLNGPYNDRFLNKRPEQPAYNLVSDEQLKSDLLAVHAKRCAECHEPAKVTRTDWIDIFAPEKSRFLVAPLAAQEGGAGKCPQSTYATKSDADFQTLLRTVQAAVKQTWERPRRDLMRCASDRALKPTITKVGAVAP